MPENKGERPAEQLLTTADVAEICRVSLQTVRRSITNGDRPSAGLRSARAPACARSIPAQTGPSHYGPYQAVRLAWFAVREDAYVYLYPCDTAVTKPQDAAAAPSGSPDHYATRGVGCAIVPGAECPIWEEFLRRSLPAGTAETLQEWFGAGLIRGKIRALRKGLISAPLLGGNTCGLTVRAWASASACSR